MSATRSVPDGDEVARSPGACSRWTPAWTCGGVSRRDGCSSPESTAVRLRSSVSQRLHRLRGRHPAGQRGCSGGCARPGRRLTSMPQSSRPSDATAGRRLASSADEAQWKEQLCGVVRAACPSSTLHCYGERGQAQYERPGDLADITDLNVYRESFENADDERDPPAAGGPSADEGRSGWGRVRGYPIGLREGRPASPGGQHSRCGGQHQSPVDDRRSSKTVSDEYAQDRHHGQHRRGGLGSRSRIQLPDFESSTSARGTDQGSDSTSG